MANIGNSVLLTKQFPTKYLKVSDEGIAALHAVMLKVLMDLELYVNAVGHDNIAKYEVHNHLSTDLINRHFNEVFCRFK